ncbi:MAG: carboxylating nicotinate-nucleotide diphosphorylase [Vicinamibacteria bacterium]|jgi:nicotinate-nucleotide pyrophosphorylase (carboxylating)|nr:carboxylating nicotinate-nucleotide diphosphorylase [Vicinamibacteria bacterium]
MNDADYRPIDALPDEIASIIRAALREDIGQGDLTTSATVAESAAAQGQWIAKQDLVLSGMDVALAVMRELDAQAVWQGDASEGRRLRAGETIGFVRGRARALLSSERVALNLLQRLSGVATVTAEYVAAVRGTRTIVRDTRKTTPLLRALQKRAVLAGGAEVHRAGLDRGILIKENHIRLAGSIEEATRRARALPNPPMVEVEVERVDQIEDALGAGAQMLLLDNFNVDDVRSAVAQIQGRVPVEVSGGITLATIRDYALAGVDYIAVGALTHSAPAVDISLEIVGL